MPEPGAPPSRTIDVLLGSGRDVAASIGDAAAALGVGLSVTESPTEHTRIGDVVLPPEHEAWLIEAALLRALAPRHVLFLCVANSARSQLAEGIARDLAGDGVRISSAGSAPTSVRPEAVAVMDEIGIDISGHSSIGVDDVERPVDAVVTLCAEEVCPVWLGDAWRLHWGMPDPAAVGGSYAERLAAFRDVRDELRTRLSVLLDPPQGA